MHQTDERRSASSIRRRFPSESLTISVREAEHFLTQDPSTRLLPVRVPSDLNPSLMQPPTPPSSDDDDDESPTESSESEAEESEYEEPIEPKRSMGKKSSVQRVGSKPPEKRPSKQEETDDDDESSTESIESEAEESEYEEPIEPKKSIEKKSSVQRVASKPPEKKPSKQEKTSKTNSNQLTRDGHSKTKSSAPKASEFVAVTATKSGGKRKLSKQILVSMDGISDYDTLAWGLPEGYPWWPVYIINPMKIRLQLHHVESDHAALVKKAKLFPDHFRAVFLFGQRTISLLKNTSAFIQKWNCDDHKRFIDGVSPSLLNEMHDTMSLRLATAVFDAQVFLMQDPSKRVLPRMVPSDKSRPLEPPPTPPVSNSDGEDSPGRSKPTESNGTERQIFCTKRSSTETTTGQSSQGKSPKQLRVSAAPENKTTSKPNTASSTSTLEKQNSTSMKGISDYDTVAWGLLDGHPWWPMYIIAPTKIPSKLHILGDDHVSIADKITQFPNLYRLVYFFGWDEIKLLRNSTACIKKWQCDQHHQFAQGDPKDIFDKMDYIYAESLADALKEAEHFISQDPSTRVLPLMVASDLNPSQEPPPSSLLNSSNSGNSSKRNNEEDNCEESIQTKQKPKQPSPSAEPKSAVAVTGEPSHEMSSSQLGVTTAAVSPPTKNVADKITEITPRTIQSSVATTQPSHTALTTNSLRLQLQLKVDMEQGQPMTWWTRQVQQRRRKGYKKYPQGNTIPQMQWKSSLRLMQRTNSANCAGAANAADQCVTPCRQTVEAQTKTQENQLNTSNTMKNQQTTRQTSSSNLTTISQTTQEKPREPAKASHAMEKQPAIEPMNIVLDSSTKGIATTTVSASSTTSTAENSTTTSSSYDSVAWVKLGDNPWWPMYIIDPMKIRANLRLVGDEYIGLLKKAKMHPHQYRVVYLFEAHTIFVWRRSGALLQKWKCDDHERLCTGLPENCFKTNVNLKPGLVQALNEVEFFLSQDPETRLLPKMRPSDMARPSVHARPILELSSEESDDSSESNPTEESSEGPLEEEDDSLESDASESDYEQPKSKKKSKQKVSPAKRCASTTRRTDRLNTTPLKKHKASRNEGNQVTIDLTEGSHPNDKAKQRNGATTTPATIDLSEDVIEAAQSPSAAASTASDAPRVGRQITIDLTNNLEKNVESHARALTKADFKAKLDDEIRQILADNRLESLTLHRVHSILSKKLSIDMNEHRELIRKLVQRTVTSSRP
ncbi:hypothetical protein LEN26_010092 [Aphanomyces euteiches]|nr:hypothetical protein LEN26_010092 [Aphanomyces euteiches]